MGSSARVSQSLSEELGSELVTAGSFAAVAAAAAKTVSGITKANPGVVTFAAAHGYANGDIIYFSGLTEMTELNTQHWQLQNNAGDTFELAVVYGGASLDTLGYVAAETTGGACAQKETFTNWTQGVGWHVGVDGAGALTGKAQKVAGTASDLFQNIATGVLASNTVTQANMKISAVNGTAFTDFSTAGILTDYVGKYLTIKDSAGAVIGGWIKAAGTGETLDAELITAWTNNVGWDTITIDGKNITEATEAGVNAYLGTGDLGITIEACYKFVHTFSIVAGSAPKYYLGSSGAGEFPTGQFFYDVGTLPVGTTTKYFTGDSSTNDWLWFVTPGAVTSCALTPSGKKVLTPAATGVTIVSTKNGSTYNWDFKQSTFNYNDASGYTYYIDDISVYRQTSVITRTAGSINQDLSGEDGVTVSASGTVFDYFLTAAGIAKLNADSSFAGTIDDVSVKEVVRRAIPD